MDCFRLASTRSVVCDVISMLTSVAGGRDQVHTQLFLQSRYALVEITTTVNKISNNVHIKVLQTQCWSYDNSFGARKDDRTNWKKSEQNSLSPPFRCKHLKLREAASWHGSKYSLFLLLGSISLNASQDQAKVKRVPIHTLRKYSLP